MTAHPYRPEPEPYKFCNIIYRPAKPRKRLDGVTIFYLITIAFFVIAMIFF